jgi:hypothetical protein
MNSPKYTGWDQHQYVGVFGYILGRCIVYLMHGGIFLIALEETMHKFFVLLLLAALTACSKIAVLPEANRASESLLQNMASMQFPRDLQIQQPFITAELPDEKPGVEVYQVADNSLLVEPEFMEPTEPEFMEPEEPEFVQPEMPEFMKPSHPDFM